MEARDIFVVVVVEIVLSFMLVMTAFLLYADKVVNSRVLRCVCSKECRLSRYWLLEQVATVQSEEDTCTGVYVWGVMWR